MSEASTLIPWPVDPRLDAAQAELLESIAQLDRVMASMAALRARMVDQARELLVEVVASQPNARGGRRDRELARDLLVSELAPLLRITLGAAAGLVAESRSLVAELPATLEALGAGRISYRHATTVVENAYSLPDEARAAYEHAVLRDADRLNVARFRDRARRVRERLHPDSISTRRRAQLERRSVAIDPGRDGMVWLSAYLPAETGVAIDDRLDRLAASMRDPADDRTFAQLRADAFCELLVRGAVPGTAQGGIRAQVFVTVPVLTLLGHDDEPATLDGYGPIPPEAARVLAAEASSFIRLLTHPETGSVLSVGRDRYAVPADLRNYLRVRDETCRGVGCGRRAATSDIDHGQAWGDGGPTSADNLAHLCRGDHTRKHRLGWRAKHLPGGVMQWTSPFGRTYLTEPATVMRT